MRIVLRDARTLIQVAKSDSPEKAYITSESLQPSGNDIHDLLKPKALLQHARRKRGTGGDDYFMVEYVPFHERPLHDILILGGETFSPEAVGNDSSDVAVTLDKLDFGDGVDQSQTVGVPGNAIHPHSKFRLTLDLCGMIAIAYDAVMIPVR